MCVRKSEWKGTFFRPDWVTDITQLGYLNRQKSEKVVLFQKVLNRMVVHVERVFLTVRRSNFFFQSRDHSDRVLFSGRWWRHILTQEMSDWPPKWVPCFQRIPFLEWYLSRCHWKTMYACFHCEIYWMFLPLLDFKFYLQKRLIEKSIECNNHKAQPTPDTRRKRKMTKSNTYKTNKQTYEKHTDQLPLPQARWSQCYQQWRKTRTKSTGRL